MASCTATAVSARTPWRRTCGCGGVRLPAGWAASCAPCVALPRRRREQIVWSRWHDAKYCGGGAETLRDQEWRISRNAISVEAWSFASVYVNLSSFNPPGVCLQTSPCLQEKMHVLPFPLFRGAALRWKFCLIIYATSAQVLA